MPRACEPRLGGFPAQGRHNEWVCVVDAENDGEYFWNRLDNSTCWRLPRGVKHRWCLLPSGLYRDVVTQVERGFSDPAFDSRPAFRVCREEYRKIGFLSLLVLKHFAPCSLLLFSGPDARHPGRYGPEGHVCRWLFVVVMTHLALYFSSGVRSRCSASLPVWNQKDSYASVAYARLVCWLRCTPRSISDSVQALAVGSGTASRAHCH